MVAQFDLARKVPNMHSDCGIHSTNVFARIWLFAALLIITCNASARAATFYVATNGSDINPGTEAKPFLTIAKGVDTAAAGDSVAVEGGLYTGAGNVNLYVSKTVHVTGLGAVTNPTVMLGDTTGGRSITAFTVSTSSTDQPTFTNLTVLNFQYSFKILGGSPSISNCKIEDADQELASVGVVVIAGDPTFNNCKFVGAQNQKRREYQQWHHLGK